jgi:hypothetical protein
MYLARKKDIDENDAEDTYDDLFNGDDPNVQENSENID